MTINAKPRAQRSGAGGILTLCLAAAVLLTACHAGPRNFLNENDRLRRENLELLESVERHERRIESLNRVIAAQEKQLAAKQDLPPLPEGVQRPVCSRIAIGAFSGGVDTDNDGHDDLLRIYLQTYDQQDRNIVTLARVKVTAAVVPPGEQAVTLATKTWDAKSFDAAYRSSFAGTHHTLEIPIAGNLPAQITQLTVSIELTDLLHSHTLQTQQPLRFTP